MDISENEILESEDWKFFDNTKTYSISKDGEVYSFRLGRMLKQYTDLNGYRVVHLHNKPMFVHRLVCQLFVGKEREDASFVNHINGIRDDNRHINLEWVSASENQKHRYAVLKQKPSGPACCLTRAQADEIKELYSSGNYTKKELAKRFLVSEQTIGRVIFQTEKQFPEEIASYEINNPERWKPIVGFEEYLVSCDGKIYSSKSKKLMSQSTNSGYKTVGLCKDGKTHRFFVHRLVALHWVDNPNKKEYVNHLDENKTNNHYSNLEWSTQKENSQYSRRLLLTADQDLIDKIRSDYMNGKGEKEIASDTKIGVITIRKIICGTGSYKNISASVPPVKELHKKRKPVVVKIDRSPPSNRDEIWLEFCDGYFVSNHGRVWNKKTGKIRELDVRGHKSPAIKIKNKTYIISRLVIESFSDVIPEDNERFVMHIDGNPLNNHIENLRWSSYGESRIASNRSNSIYISDKDILEMREMKSNGATLKEIREKYNISQGTLCCILYKCGAYKDR